MRLFVAFALLPAALAQSRPAISSNGRNVSVLTGPNGYLQVNGAAVATADDLYNAAAGTEAAIVSPALLLYALVGHVPIMCSC